MYQQPSMGTSDPDPLPRPEIIEMCFWYNTDGYPNFRPICTKHHLFHPSLRCHTKNACPGYKPSQLGELRS